MGLHHRADGDDMARLNLHSAVVRRNRAAGPGTGRVPVAGLGRETGLAPVDRQVDAAGTGTALGIGDREREVLAAGTRRRHALAERIAAGRAGLGRSGVVGQRVGIGTRSIGNSSREGDRLPGAGGAGAGGEAGHRGWRIRRVQFYHPVVIAAVIARHVAVVAISEARYHVAPVPAGREGIGTFAS